MALASQVPVIEAELAQLTTGVVANSNVAVAAVTITDMAAGVAVAVGARTLLTSSDAEAAPGGPVVRQRGRPRSRLGTTPATFHNGDRC